MAYVPLAIVAMLTLLSAVTLVRMIREDGRGPAPPPRSHQGDGPPLAWWTDGEQPPDDEHPVGPRVLLIDKSPGPRRS
ncbi:hypothetical protein [Nocardioides sp.]|uniref:hypothetical protein n=1 Tax=Nocardioides sp. TaxID=35761 RepID=UPI002734325D|nr:hypothetical protein [Nocardioides sp.]MDP3890144.1 hypothetical protein [Nocardioides sp.]